MDERLSAWATRQRAEYKNGTLSQEKIELLNSIGFNWETRLANVSLAESNPELAAEWHPTKNGTLTPANVGYGSAKKVWWLCDKGHEWQATVGNRIKGSGCPYCSGRYVIPGVNDLASCNSSLASEWHPTKNGTLTPADICVSSGKKVWWKCKKGHEWEATVNYRNRRPICPYCTNRKILIGVNDLSTTHPEIATQWHPTKNDPLKPSEVTASDNNQVWWTCDAGHEWKARISARVQGVSCPFCSGRKAIPGFNDFGTRYPDLAAEWHPTKNGSLVPSAFLPYSMKKVWWRCKKGHEWYATINTRSQGHGCPYCAGKKVIPGVNDLATRFPAIAAEFHPTKNAPLTVHDIMPNSMKKVWWRCKKGHEWQATPNTRQKSGCPYCARKTRRKEDAAHG